MTDGLVVLVRRHHRLSEGARVPTFNGVESILGRYYLGGCSPDGGQTSKRQDPVILPRYFPR